MAPPEVIVSNAAVIVRTADGDTATRGPFNLSIRGGEFLALLGPAGSAKSTIVKMIAGLMPVSAGEVRIGSHRVESPQLNLGIVFETPLLMGWRTALENVLLQAEVRGLDRHSSVDQARRLLAMLGLSGCESLLPHMLSPGMAVRVAVCRALVHDPPILLMDDPFRDLDPLDREQIATDIQRLSLSPRTTVLLATRLPTEAVQLSDRVAVLSPEGRVQQYFSIELPRPRRLDKAMTPVISECCSAIRTLLQAQGTLS